MEIKSRYWLLIGILLIFLITGLGLRAAFEGASDTRRVNEHSMPILRQLYEMRFGVMRIVSSTSEYLVIKLTGLPDDDDDAGSPIEKGKVPSSETERNLIENGRKTFAEARQNLSLILGKAQHWRASDNYAAIDQAHAALIEEAESILGLVDAGATAQRIATSKDEFERREHIALKAIQAAIDDETNEVDGDTDRIANSIKSLRNELLLLFLLLMGYSYLVFRVLKSEALARRAAEDLLKLNALESEQRRRLEQRLAAQQKLDALGTMVGGIAHSVNNLLVPVVTLSAMLREMAPEGSEEKGDLARIEAAGTRASALMRDVMAFSRSDKSSREDRCEMIQTLAKGLSIARASLPPTVTLTESLPRSPLWVGCDEGTLDTALLNLIGNARDALVGINRGRIEVSVEVVDVAGQQLNGDAVNVADGQYSRLSVCDNGPGVPPEIREHIFDPFFTTKDVGKGAGLGLSITHTAITRAGGDIVIASVEGGGACFAIYLPLVDPDGSDTERKSQ